MPMARARVLQKDGTGLARRHDVVVVTANYCCNAFGYLYLQRFVGASYADSGNCGQLDLVLALEWLRINIEALRRRPAKGPRLRAVRWRRKDSHHDGNARPRRACSAPRPASMSGQSKSPSPARGNATRRTRTFLEAAARSARCSDPPGRCACGAPARRLVGTGSGAALRFRSFRAGSLICAT